MSDRLTLCSELRLRELLEKESQLSASEARVRELEGVLEKVPGELRKLADHHLTANGNLSQEQKIWAHDTLLVACGWIDSFTVKPALGKGSGREETESS